MSNSTKKIEVLTIEMQNENDFSFADLLKNDKIEEEEIWIGGKWVSINILQKGTSIIIGVVATSRNTNIPAKKKRGSKKTKKIGLDDDEGLVYGNVFLFDSRKNLLLYEVSKFGCYLDHFIEYFYKCFEGDDNLESFNLIASPVLNRNEYQRMLKMNQHKSLEVSLANPKQILDEFEGKNNAMLEMVRTAAKINSERFKWKYEINARSPRSLANQTLIQIVDQLLRVFGSNAGGNVEKVEIRGYEEDPDTNKIAKIDLIADRFQASISLDEPRENEDLLEEQRRSEILKEFHRIKPELDKIIK